VSGYISVRWAAVPLVVLTGAAVLFTMERAASYAVGRRIAQAESGAVFSSLSWGVNTVLIHGLYLPERGLYADSTWVLMEGFPFEPRPVEVVLSGVVLALETQRDTGPGQPEASRLRSVSILEGRASADGTSVFLHRSGGTDHLSLSGPWGSAVIRRDGEDFFAVFQRCSAFPLAMVDVPRFAEGRTVSGFCRGVVGDGIRVSGEITGIDERPASALFLYESAGGHTHARLELDFSQVASPALAYLEEVTNGAVTSSVPSGSLIVSLGSMDSVFLETMLSFDSVHVDHRSIAPESFHTSASLFSRGCFLPGSSSLHIDSGVLVMGSAAVNFSLEASWGQRRRMLIHLQNDSLRGEDITVSVPRQLLGRLSGLSLSGILAFDCSLVLDWDYPDSCDISLSIDASGLQVDYSPLSFNGLQHPSGATTSMRDSWGNTSLIGLDTLSNPDFVVFDSLPFFFEPLLCCAEDATFRRHSGFSEYHIRNSIRADMSAGRLVRGGSTISMQLAKNLFLGREKTFSRKLQEVFLTWRMERWLTKNRILEIYANLVELGPGVFGFDSAALYYFGKPVTEVSVREMAFLVSILPGPGIYHRYGVVGVVPSHWNAYIDRLIGICGNRGLIPDSLVAEALAENLVFRGPVSLQRVDNR
jgi:hypothetical protein